MEGALARRHFACRLLLLSGGSVRRRRLLRRGAGERGQSKDGAERQESLHVLLSPTRRVALGNRAG